MLTVNMLITMLSYVEVLSLKSCWKFNWNCNATETRMNSYH